MNVTADLILVSFGVIVTYLVVRSQIFQNTRDWVDEKFAVPAYKLGKPIPKWVRVLKCDTCFSFYATLLSLIVFKAMWNSVINDETVQIAGYQVLLFTFIWLQTIAVLRCI